MNSHRALTRNRKMGADLSIAVSLACGPNDVVISPRFVGLSGTDVQVYRGALLGEANILGHEGVGVITEVGSAISSWSCGDAVVFNSVNPTNRDAVLGFSYDGLLQERFLVERAESMDWLIHRIPADLLKPIGVLIEPLAAAIYSSELVSGKRDSNTAVVVGDGPVALLNSIVLGISGFKSVLMIHGRSTRGRWAVENGYFERSDVISSRGDTIGNVVSRLGGELADVAVICTPGEAVEQATRDALGYLKPGGLIDFVSTATPAVISLEAGDLNVRDLQRLNYGELAVATSVVEFEFAVGKVMRMTGQRGVVAAHIQASVDLLTKNSRSFKKLVTDVVKFDDADSLISSAVEWSLGRRSGDRPMKTVIELNGDSPAAG